MLNKLRSFSKGKIAPFLVAIIIVPFVFWGMGSVFSGGNKNSVAKINNLNISTENFINYINRSKIKTEIIKDNIDENILEDLLTQLVSNTLIDIEIKDQNIRLVGIDAPEKKQLCKKPYLNLFIFTFSKSYPCGETSSNSLKKFINNQIILCKIEEKKDFFKRWQCFSRS